MRIVGLAVTVICLVAVAGVEALAIYYSALPPELRPLAAGAFVIMAMLLVLTGIRIGYRRYWAAFLLMAGVVAAAWRWLAVICPLRPTP